VKTEFFNVSRAILVREQEERERAKDRKDVQETFLYSRLVKMWAGAP